MNCEVCPGYYGSHDPNCTAWNDEQAELARLRACVRAAVELWYNRPQDMKWTGASAKPLSRRFWKAELAFHKACDLVTLPDEPEPIADDTA